MKILIHSINGVGLGHLNRSIILAKELKSVGVDTRIITNAKFTKQLDYAGLKYYRLPYAIHGGQPRANLDSMKKENKKVMKFIMEEFNPDIVVYDTYPFYEILNDKCSSDKTNVLILRKLEDAFLRKLLNDPILKKFQLVMLPHTLDEFKKSKVSNDVLEKLKSDKFIFVGPLVKEANLEIIDEIKKNYKIEENKFNVLVTAGGGGTDKYNIGVESFFRMIKNVSYLLEKKIKNLNLIIIKGPYCDKDIKIKNATIKQFEPNLMELISSVDLVISTAGYNMCNEICKVKTPAIMVPLPRHIESQEERVINLEKIGTVINLNRYDANKLSEIVLELYNNREKLQKMKKAFNKIKLDVGNKKAAEEILKLNQEKLPSIASIKLSKHCNNNCIFCSKLEFKLQSEKSIEQIKEELNEMRRKGVKELSLPCNSDTREDLLNIAAYAKWLGFKVTLNTNGRVLSYKDFAEKVAGAVDQFNVYLNGHTAELHDPITKVKGSFEQTIEGIKNLKKMNQDVVIKVVVDKRNYNELEKITRLLDKIKVNKLQFVFLDEHPPLDKVIPPLLKAIDFAERNGIEINFNKYRRLLGVVTGRLFRGPEIVQIDPTNKCNYNCVYCWSYSPLLKSRKSVEWNKQEIEFDFFKRIVDELAKLNVDIISLPGGGEPFMHPRIMDMIEYVKSKGLKLSILTNASLMSKDVVERIVGLGVDHLLVNISCASPETYTKMHPNQKMERFNEIKNNLVYLNELKKRSKMKNPYIKIVNMITNFNYREMPAMVEFAKEIGADFVSFKPTSTLEGTNSLLLSKEQIEEAVNHAKKLLVKMKEEGIDNNLDNFIKLVTQDLSGQYTEDLIRKIGCYTTWYYWRVTADKTFAPCCHAPIHVKIGEDRFEEIWNSPTYKKFRRKIKEHNQKKEKVAYEECKICEHFKKNSEILKELEKHNLLQFLDDRYG